MAKSSLFRLFYLILPALWAVLIGFGLWLSPDNRGYGTHEQLGLPPCPFRWLAGYPCPSCGLTTSISAIVHGQFGAAWQANPPGFLIFFGLGWLSILSLKDALSDSRSLRNFLNRLPLWTIFAIVLIFIVLWLIRLS